MDPPVEPVVGPTDSILEIWASARLRKNEADAEHPCPHDVQVTALYLYVNAALYIGLAAWCTVLPTKTSEAIGFAFTKSAARSEYITIYGGLELGMGLFFLAAGFLPALRPAGIVFALAVYACLALFRIGTLIAIDDLGRFPYVMLTIELPMALLAAWLTFRPGGAASTLLG